MLWTLLWMAVAPVVSAQQALEPIASLDVPRYMGRWYELAKLPNRFQDKCVADTFASYS